MEITFIIQSLLFLLLFLSLEKRNINTTKSHPGAEPAWTTVLRPSEPRHTPAFHTMQKPSKRPSHGMEKRPWHQNTRRLPALFSNRAGETLFHFHPAQLIQTGVNITLLWPRESSPAQGASSPCLLHRASGHPGIWLSKTGINQVWLHLISNTNSPVGAAANPPCEGEGRHHCSRLETTRAGRNFLLRSGWPWTGSRCPVF